MCGQVVCVYLILFFAEEVILNEERTTDEEKLKIIEGKKTNEKINKRIVELLNTVFAL